MRLPVEQVQVGWLRVADGSYRAALTFVDEWGQRSHLLDGDACLTVGAELQRLGRFVKSGLEPPPAGP